MDRETQLSEFCTLGLKRSSQEKLQLHLKGNTTDLASLYRLPGGHRVQPGLQMKRGLDGGHQRHPPIPDRWVQPQYPTCPVEVVGLHLTQKTCWEHQASPWGCKRFLNEQVPAHQGLKSTGLEAPALGRPQRSRTPFRIHGQNILGRSASISQIFDPSETGNPELVKEKETAPTAPPASGGCQQPPCSVARGCFAPISTSLSTWLSPRDSLSQMSLSCLL